MRLFFNGGAYTELIETLKQMGHTIIEHDATWLDYSDANDKGRAYNNLLKQRIAETKPDVYVGSKGLRDNFRIFPETHQAISKNVGMMVYWSMDDPFFMRHFLANKIYTGYRIALTCTTESFSQYQNVGLKPYLFWPAFDTIMRKYTQVEEKDKIDFVFVGTPYADTEVPRKKLVLGLLHSGIRNVELYGNPAWKEDTKKFKYEDGLAKFYKGTYPFANVHQLFNKARLNLSNHIRRAELYLNDRVPMVMGVGGFLFLDRNPGFEKYFLHEEDVVYYNDYEDFLKKAKYYIDRPDLRAQIGANARNKILRKHTYKQRAEQLLNILKENGIK